MQEINHTLTLLTSLLELHFFLFWQTLASDKTSRMIQSFVLRQMKKNTKTRLSMSHYSMRLQQDKVRRLMYIQSQQLICVSSSVCTSVCVSVCTSVCVSVWHHSMQLQQDKVRRLMYMQSQQHVCIIMCVYICLCVCVTSLHAAPARRDKKADVHAVPSTHMYIIVFFWLIQNSAVQYICNGPVGKVIWQR